MPRITEFAGRVGRACACAAVLALAGGCACPRRPMDLGFITTVDRSPAGAGRVRALGPILEGRDSPAGSLRAVRPFYSRVRDETRGWSGLDVLWPLATTRVFEGSRFWRVGWAYGHDFGPGEPGSRYRCIVLPFLFAGRDKDGEGYFALFPLGGTIHEFLAQDRMWFVLFPLYGHSAIGELETHSVLWPIFSRTTGPGVDRVRVFPFYGRSLNEDRWLKHFVLWPVWTSVRYLYPDDPGGGFILFPFYGQIDTRDQRTRMVLPPFFRWSRNGEERLVHCPWPFVQYQAGAVDKLYLWPVWGRRSSKGVEKRFYAWPLVSTEHVDRGEVVLDGWRVVPVWQHEVVRSEAGEGVAGEAVARYWKLWPLCSYRRAEGDSRFRALALWPGHDAAAIERNLAPLWSLYTRERRDGVSENELLWGLFRTRQEADGSRKGGLFPLLSWARSGEGEAGPARRRWSVLGGLLGYEREDLRKTFKVLYFFTFGGRRQDDE